MLRSCHGRSSVQTRGAVPCNAHLTGRSCGPSTARVPPQEWGAGAPLPPMSADPQASFMTLWALPQPHHLPAIQTIPELPCSLCSQGGRALLPTEGRAGTHTHTPLLPCSGPFFLPHKGPNSSSLSFMDKLLEVAGLWPLRHSVCCAPATLLRLRQGLSGPGHPLSPALLQLLPGSPAAASLSPWAFPALPRPGWGQAVCSGRCPSPQSSVSLPWKSVHSSALTQLSPWPLWFVIFRIFFVKDLFI